MPNHFARKLLIAAAALLALFGATAWGAAAAHPAAANSAPTLSAVAPQALPNQTNMYITVSGQNFLATPSLTLGTLPLPDVTFIDSQTLSAFVPWGLATGSYTLTLTNPDGLSATLPNACSVYAESGDWASNGPYGGQITDLYIDPQDSQAIYANAWSSGLFASADAAGSWQPIFLDPMPTEMTFQPLAGGRALYIGGSNSLYRSSDEGATWQRFNPPEVEIELSQDPFDFHPALNPAAPASLYLGVSGNPNVTNGGGLFEYNSASDQWIKRYPQDIHVKSVAFDPADPNRLFFGTREGAFYTSPDGGLAWSDPVQVSSHIQQIAVDPFLNGSGHHNIWIATNAPGYIGEGAFLSQDGGQTFQRIENLPNPTAWVNSVTIHPAIPGMIWLAADGGYFSLNNASTWSAVPGNLPGVRKFALLPDPAAPGDPARLTVYAATEVGVYKSTDGGQNWQAANHGLMGVIPESLAVNPQNPDEAYANTPSLNILRTRDGGRNWQQLDIPFAGWRARMAVDPFTPSTVYFPASLYMEAAINISPDSGATYQSVALPRPSEVSSQWQGRVMAIAPDPAQPGRLLAGASFEQYAVNETHGAIYLRANASASWRIVAVLSGQVRQIYFDPHDPQRLYATSDAGLYRSTDGGETWNRLDTPAALQTIALVAVHPDDANTIYIYNWSAPGEEVSSQGLYLSQDGGLTWALLTDSQGNGVYGAPVWEIGFAPLGPRIFYLATFTGLYSSLDDGHTITPVSGLPGSANAQALAFGREDNRLVIYVGTTGGYTTRALASQNAQTEILAAGIYRSNTVFQYFDYLISLPLVVK